MYFTDEIKPTELPLRAVMHYYVIQEGAACKPAKPAKPKRMYFVGGASTWIDKLVGYMRNTLGIEVKRNFPVRISFDGGRWALHKDGLIHAEPPIVVDKVVIATHADDALKLFVSGASPAVVSCLSAISYLDGLSVAHTFIGMLPPDYNAWRTYNILIHQPPETAPQALYHYLCVQSPPERFAKS